MDPHSRPWWLEALPVGTADRAARATGLSTAEAKTRLARYGPNLFRDARKTPLLLQYLALVKNPLVIILLVARAVSPAFTSAVTNFEIGPRRFGIRRKVLLRCGSQCRDSIEVFSGAMDA
jgi:Mg2+-importing ATPase